MTDQADRNIQDVILDSIADGVFTVDLEWSITSFNRAAEEITGILREEAVGQPCCDVFRASICEKDCALRRTMDTGKPVVNRAIYIVDADGERIPISVSTSLLKDKDGQVIGGVETFRDLTLVAELRKELAKSHSCHDIISRNHRIMELFHVLPRIAESGSTVLIEGESGTGKELFARAVHDLSPRKEKPFVAVNCSALPDTLLESELFGYKAGAFTDARKDKPGRFALAQGGTLFLDEIGDVSAALQARLLRVLQDGTYEPLGSTAPVNAYVRVIAATNKRLSRLVKQGTFREDLFYRIHVVRIELPPLRERREDLPLLAEHFIAKFNRLQGKDITGIDPEALALLMKHDFRGNVRELQNVIEHAFVLCQGAMILPRHLPDTLHPKEEGRPLSGGASLADQEARLIYETLERNQWNQTRTAKELGIHKTTLWRKIQKLGLKAPKGGEGP